MTIVDTVDLQRGGGSARPKRERRKRGRIVAAIVHKHGNLEDKTPINSSEEERKREEQEATRGNKGGTAQEGAEE